jgi:DNA-binding CsgD family transcriptional regulator
MLDLGCGVVGVLHDATRAVPEPPEVLAFKMSQVSPESLAVFAPLSRAASSPEVSRRFQMGGPVGTFSRTLGRHGADFKRVIRSVGITDALYLLTGDTSSIHCVLSTLSRGPVKVSRGKRLHLGRVAAHIATGFRLARATASTHASARPNSGEGSPELEAVLTPRGTIEHALGRAASNDGREALREAAKALERARGPMRRRDPEDAVRHWQALVAGRWSLIDHFDSDGKRFVIARPNEPTGLQLSGLTPRERQVLGLAAHGHAYKIIGYELGLSISTVATHLNRAMAKLGIDSRRQLLTLLSVLPPHLAEDKHLANAGAE